MAIQDDFTIDYTLRRITYTTAFVNDRPPSIYTVNELYSYLQDTFDEPAQMDDPVPMSAQTPTQYTLINSWFMDDETTKSLYGGSIQTNGWTHSASEGITQLRWTNGSADPPIAGDIGVTLTGGSSGATGVLLAVNATRQVAWVRNTSVAQFSDNEAVTGTGVTIQTETVSGVQNGETVWANLFSVGSLQENTEIYVGQEDDYMGGRAYHTANPHQRRIEKIDEWWDSDVDFFTGSPNLLGGAGHFDVLVKVREAGSFIDGGRLGVFARQFSKVYSHFVVTASTAGNFVVPFASTGADLNSQDGPYTVAFANRAGADLEVGDILENDTGTTPVGRLRAVVTAVTGGASTTGTIEYYLIGENESLGTFSRTLNQFENLDNVRVRGDTTTFDISGSPSAVTNGPAQSQGISVTFGATQFDVDEDSSTEQYACTVDCNNIPLAQVYQRLMFLTSRGNQDGTTPDTQDTLLPTATAVDEPSEFYKAVGDIVFNYDGGIGTQLSEGDYVENLAATASGVVVSGGTTGMGTTGVLVLTQVKGTFSNNDQVARPGEHATNRVDVFGTPSTLAANTGAPFGSFAGGRFFFARGVFPTNVPAADANNWETTDLAGTRRAPPTVRSITFSGLAANDRAAIFEVNTAGTNDIRKDQNGVGAAGAAVGATSIPLDSASALDIPSAGWVRIVDVSSPTLEEYRYRYMSVSGTTVTLDSGAGLSGTTTGSESATVLTDTGAFTTFGGVGEVRIGMQIRNVSDGSRAVVLRKIDNNSIETTPLIGGSSNTWHSGGTADSWEANTVVVALVDADTVYFPFIDDVATGSTLATTVKYVEDTPLIARARFSDPDIGGTRILPFEQLGITLTDANLTVTAIRTSDPIAS